MGKGDIEHRLKVYANYLRHEIEVQGTLSERYSDAIKSARAQGGSAALEEAVKVLDNTFPEFKLGQLAQSEKPEVSSVGTSKAYTFPH